MRPDAATRVPRRPRAARRAAALAAALALAHLAGPAAAADPPAAGVAAPDEAPAPGPDVRRDTPEVVRLGQRLRCPVCQGMAIGDSPAPMAQDMMRQVRRMWADGRNEDDIAAYFTARYGDWVLLDPPWRGAGLWVWVAPPMALVLGVAWALRSLRRRSVGAPLPDARAAEKIAPQARATVAAATDGHHGDDADLQAIRKEVAR